MTPKISPMRAIRAKCLECSNGSVREVRLCPITDCNLYPFRMGRNPYIKKRELSPEQRKIISERLANSRRNQKTPFPVKEKKTIYGKGISTYGPERDR